MRNKRWTLGSQIAISVKTGTTSVGRPAGLDRIVWWFLLKRVGVIWSRRVGIFIVVVLSPKRAFAMDSDRGIGVRRFSAGISDPARAGLVRISNIRACSSLARNADIYDSDFGVTRGVVADDVFDVPGTPTTVHCAVDIPVECILYWDCWYGVPPGGYMVGVCVGYPF